MFFGIIWTEIFGTTDSIWSSLVWGFVNESWKCTSLHVHDVPLYLWRKSRNIGSKHFEPEPGSKSRRSYFRIKVEILGHFHTYPSIILDKNNPWSLETYCIADRFIVRSFKISNFMSLKVCFFFSFFLIIEISFKCFFKMSD